MNSPLLHIRAGEKTSLWICRKQRSLKSRTFSINYFKMSGEPPNQSQLELVTSLCSLLFQSKRRRWDLKDLDALTTLVFPKSVAVVATVTEGCKPLQTLAHAGTCVYSPCFGTAGLTLWTIGVGFPRGNWLRTSVWHQEGLMKSWKVGGEPKGGC